MLCCAVLCERSTQEARKKHATRFQEARNKVSRGFQEGFKKVSRRTQKAGNKVSRRAEEKRNKVSTRFFNKGNTCFKQQLLYLLGVALQTKFVAQGAAWHKLKLFFALVAF